MVAQKSVLVRQQLKVILTRMHRAGIPKELIQRVYGYLKQAPAEAVVQMNPNRLMVKCRCSRSQMMNLLILGLFEGLFEMQWDISCPHCKNIAEHQRHLQQVKPQVFCASCQVDFTPHADENITVTISVHPNLFTNGLPQVAAGSTAEKELPPMTALELIALPAFRKYFSDQIPALDQSIKIRSVTVMFTDLIQSTQLYTDIGDINAFALVKEHFQILFSEIIGHSGGIVKTIGDAVMAVFTKARPALDVSFDIKEKVNLLLNNYALHNAFGLKVGLSQGTALIVNLNDTMDLFGTTVNRAARVVSVAGQRSVAVTQGVFDDLQVRDFIRKNDFSIKKKEHTFKGLPGLQTVYLISKGQKN